jgi:nucleoside-diphosphate-sugar epimerase
MECVVTGGAGFIGSNLVDHLLARGDRVLVVDNLSTGSLRNLTDALSSDRCDFVEVDIRDEDVITVIEKCSPEVIFHLAAQADVRVSVADPGFDAEVNILGTIKVAEGARRARCRQIVAAASGGTLYGEVDSSALPIQESSPWQPLSPYGISKKAMIDYLRSTQALHGITTTSLALGNVYGPRQDPHGEAGVIAIFSQLFLSGQPVTIYGTGQQTRDYVYVDDVVSAFIAASSAGSVGHLINVGTGIETSVNDLVREFEALTVSPVPPVHAPSRPGELDRSALDIKLARSTLGWEPAVDLKAGLALTYEWVKIDKQGVEHEVSPAGERKITL